MNVTGCDCQLDVGRWQAWLEREAVPSAGYVGVVGPNDFAARQGRLLAWRGAAGGVELSLRAFDGSPGADVAVLLVLDRDAEEVVLGTGIEAIGRLSRQGRLHVYMLQTMDELEDSGLADFVEDLGLVFPKH